MTEVRVASTGGKGQGLTFLGVNQEPPKNPTLRVPVKNQILYKLMSHTINLSHRHGYNLILYIFIQTRRALQFILHP
jgi:hypothetical protein